MSESHEITIAAKCAPDEAVLKDIEKAGITLAELVDEIKAEVVVFHDIYWDNEWEYIFDT